MNAKQVKALRQLLAQTLQRKSLFPWENTYVRDKNRTEQYWEYTDPGAADGDAGRRAELARLADDGGKTPPEWDDGGQPELQSHYSKLLQALSDGTAPEELGFTRNTRMVDGTARLSANCARYVYKRAKRALARERGLRWADKQVVTGDTQSATERAAGPQGHADSERVL